MNPNVCVLQVDNRPTLDYLLLTQKVNEKMCNHFGFDYMFINTVGKYDFAIQHYCKLYEVNRILHSTSYDVIVFLDSDAWIQNGQYLHELIMHLMNTPNKSGCFSRTPYDKRLNTYINSGSFILKNDDYIKTMYSKLIASFEHDLATYRGNTNMVRKKNKGWCDQFYVSNYVFDNNTCFFVFIPEILNTPEGIILRHNWLKNKKMYEDLDELLTSDIVINSSSYQFIENYDKNPFPNV